MTSKKWIGLLLGLFLLGCGSTQTDRQAEVARVGSEVMPFDLEKTTHIFKPLETGGLQTVQADNANDTEQITLIQQHLVKEVEQFKQGDFVDPAQIHGDEMPGLQTLRTRADEIVIEYTSLPDGAQIRYTATDEAIIQAIHVWFEAQTSDHGSHATH